MTKQDSLRVLMVNTITYDLLPQYTGRYLFMQAVFQGGLGREARCYLPD